ncbi:MAG: hypothetical protein AVDCRST_MAG41-2359, partial [uncultured Corynebacteriales bacterium]
AAAVRRSRRPGPAGEPGRGPGRVRRDGAGRLLRQRADAEPVALRRRGALPDRGDPAPGALGRTVGRGRRRPAGPHPVRGRRHRARGGLAVGARQRRAPGRAAGPEGRAGVPGGDQPVPVGPGHRRRRLRDRRRAAAAPQPAPPAGLRGDARRRQRLDRVHGSRRRPGRPGAGGGLLGRAHRAGRGPRVRRPRRAAAAGPDARRGRPPPAGVRDVAAAAPDGRRRAVARLDADGGEPRLPPPGAADPVRRHAPAERGLAGHLAYRPGRRAGAGLAGAGHRRRRGLVRAVPDQPAPGRLRVPLAMAGRAGGRRADRLRSAERAV